MEHGSTSAPTTPPISFSNSKPKAKVLRTGEPSQDGKKNFLRSRATGWQFRGIRIYERRKIYASPPHSFSQRFNSPFKQRYSAWRLKPVERGARTSPVPPGTKRRRRGRGGSTTSIPRNRPEVVGARSCGSNISTGLARNPPAISQEVADKPPPRLSLFDQLSNHELAARIPGIKDPSLSS